MRCKCKLFALDTPAKDGSVIPSYVAEKYIKSEDCQKDLKDRKMLGSLTHRARSLSNIGEHMRSNSLSKTIGADDMLLLPEKGCSCPTHYIEDMWIEEGWLMGVIKILDEEGMDDLGKNYIRRLKGLLKQGIKLPISLCVVSFWEAQPGTGQDFAKEIKKIKGADITLNESSSGAGVQEIYDDEDERIFSDVILNEFNTFDGKVKVKTFSSPYEVGIDSTTPKTSKIGGAFTVLKAKEFSVNGAVTIMAEPDEKVKEISQKGFSAISVKDRIREEKMSPRMRFRRMIISYKQVIKSMGGVEKIDPETLKIMKTLFTTDLIGLMTSITPEVIAGKPINTLLGASSLGKNVRVAVTKLQIPYKMALQENQKSGYVSKMKYEKIQAAYTEFCQALIDEVFSSKSTIPDLEEEDEENKEETN